MKNLSNGHSILPVLAAALGMLLLNESNLCAADFEVKGVTDLNAQIPFTDPPQYGIGPMLRVIETTVTSSSMEFENKDAREAKFRKITNSEGGNILNFDIRNLHPWATPTKEIRYFRDSGTGTKSVGFYNGTTETVAQIGVSEDKPTFFQRFTSIKTSEPGAALHVAGFDYNAEIPITGSNLVENGDFSSDPAPEWTLSGDEIGWYNNSIAVEGSTPPSIIEQTISGLIAGHTYTVSYFFQNSYNTQITPYLGGIAGPTAYQGGAITEQIVAGSGNLKLTLVVAPGSYCTVDDISLVENGGNVSGIFNGLVWAAGFIDDTPGWEDTPREALNQVSQIESANGRIDHDTLPEFARTNRRKLRRVERYFPTRAEAETWIATQNCAKEPQYHVGKYPAWVPASEKPQGRVIQRPNGSRFEEKEIDQCRVIVIVDEGMANHRNLGAMITMYGECIKALKTENDELRSQLLNLRTRLETLESIRP